MTRKRNWAIVETLVLRVDNYVTSDAARADVLTILRNKHPKHVEIRTFARTVRAGGAAIVLAVGVARWDRNKYTGIERKPGRDSQL